MITTAFVNIWDKKVGAIAWNENTGLGEFEYFPSFVKGQLDVAPIMMPLTESDTRIFSFSELRDKKTFKGLPGLLADVLPDQYGNTLINVWLAKNGRATESLSPVEILCFIGKRGMGALEFEPVEPNISSRSTKLEIESLINVADKILAGRKDFHTSLADNEEKALFDILKIGTSAGGARAKAIIAFNHKTGEVRSGQSKAPKGFSHWIIKFDGVHDSQFGVSAGYGRVEMAYYLMAKDADIEMTECRLIEENDRAHFITKRFDRLEDNSKLHVQTFCAMRHFDFNLVGHYSYEQLFETMRMLGLPYPQAEQLYRRMVFNIMARNCDDHTKNFAFIMDQEGNWKLSPAYDVCHAYRPGSQWVSQHSLSLNDKRKDITKEDLLVVARKMNIKKADKIIENISGIITDWDKYSNKVSVNSQLSKAIKKTHLLM